MATRRDSRLMLQRLAEKGFPVDFDALDSTFNLTITPIATVDVDATPLINFSQRVKEIVRESGFKCKLADIVVFAMVLNPQIRSAKDTVGWKRASRAYVVRRNIDFSRWQRAKSSGKEELLAECMIEAIASIPTKHLDESSKEALMAIVHHAMRSKRVPRNAQGTA